MDSFEFNKIAGAALFGLLVLVVISNLGNILVHPEHLKEDAYKVEVAEAGAQPAAKKAAEPEKPLPVLLASADEKKGEKVAKKCATCHDFTKGGPNKVGPNLWNIVGRKVGTEAGFTYSEAMGKHGGEWTYDHLFHYLKDPKAYVPGNKMAFAGLSKAEERADLLLYLRTLNDNPPPLPKAEPAAAAPAAAAPAAAPAK